MLGSLVLTFLYHSFFPFEILIFSFHILQLYIKEFSDFIALSQGTKNEYHKRTGMYFLFTIQYAVLHQLIFSSETQRNLRLPLKSWISFNNNWTCYKVIWCSVILQKHGSEHNWEEKCNHKVLQYCSYTGPKKWQKKTWKEACQRPPVTTTMMLVLLLIYGINPVQYSKYHIRLSKNYMCKWSLFLF